ncbi:MAG: hypothetical protein M1607_03320 [Patescibacteria group bacterium]|nr:hypothetical protein [Patescibacteria group bacterium]
MKRGISKGNWTNFWRRSLKINLGREESWSQKEIYQRDSRRLSRLGITTEDIDKVKAEFNKYTAGHIQFHRFVYFFARDPETVRRWTKTSNISKSFLKLCYKVTRNNRETAKSLLLELLLLTELFRKREIIQYEAKFKGVLKVSKLSSKGLLSVLKFGERNAGFKIEKEITFDNFTVYVISKKTGANLEVFKFILLKKVRNKLLINLALDTSEERNKILSYISRKLQIPINRLKEKPDLTKFIQFLQSGKSESFALSAVDFIDQGFRIGISPQYGRSDNVADNYYYKKILPTSDIDILESIQKIRIVNAASSGDMQANITFVNYKNEDIIGGMRLSLNAKGINLSKRESLKADFKKDFNFQLDTPLVFEVDEKEIYKKFLYNPPKKKKRIEIVSDKSIEISHKLLKYSLLPQPKSIEETAKICTFHGCPLRFRYQWTDNKICSCGNDLWDKGSTIVTQVIDEKVVRDFINRIAEESGYNTTPLIRDLVKRKIYPVEITKDHQSICLIPITVPLKDQQLEVLKYRYPNLIFVTSRDDSDVLKSKGFIVEDLYNFVYELFNDSKAKIDYLLNVVTSNKSTNIGTLAQISSGRIMDDKWYIEQTSMGAEFFEADTSMLLNYIFKNSIWLGAKRRGQRFPDSLSAFPIEDTNRGCFISDAKFSIGSCPDIGSRDKNKQYVTDGKKNLSVCNNGGLKGFIFVGNKPAPSNFISKMAKVIGRRIIKVGYLKNSHILSIYDHLRHWEDEMNMDQRKRDIFLNSMELIFLLPKSLKNEDKFIVWNDNVIKQVLDDAVTEYNKLGSPKLIV